MVSALVPPWIAIVADLAFPLVLVGVVAREIVAGRNWHNLSTIAPVIVLGAANLLMHLEADGVAVPPGLGWRLGLAAVIVLISVMGGRIIPSFTRNWLAKRPGAQLPATHGRIDRVALGVLHTSLLSWAGFPDSRVSGALLLFGAGLNLWRMLRWRGGATVTEPLLFVLHVGYAWLVLGVALLGLASLGADLPPGAAIHALTAGAIGTMILAVMTRAIRGHTGRELSADRVTSLIYVLVTIGAVTRVAAGFGSALTMPLLFASAGLWIAAFGGFVLSYGPMLSLPRDRA
jgi:uncharacterized protein involved in response to NO